MIHGPWQDSLNIFKLEGSVNYSIHHNSRGKIVISLASFPPSSLYGTQCVDYNYFGTKFEFWPTIGDVIMTKMGGVLVTSQTFYRSKDVILLKYH